jgi:hypothetical protein
LMFPRFAGPMVGASAGICGLLAAFAVLEPESVIHVMMILPVRAKYLLPVVIVLPLIFMVSGDQHRVAHAAHLGGALAGVGYIHFFVRSGTTFFDIERLRRLFARRQLVRSHTVKRPFRQRDTAARPDNFSPDDFISKEVDPILDKISAHGIQSLTERERKILEAARAKMAKR